MTIVTVILISAISFVCGFCLACMWLKEEKNDLKKACDEALSKLEPIAESMKEHEVNP